ncbi:MAG: S-methyl-5'-thioadenosine phosphorylase [Chloroflexota bacterium]|jgi:5'-methylthioadenosine phosphorylase|nr:S-methyl-5'-thioadenosine phosphorylase [Chloroflexota bacterium]MDP6509294.1 S-methyl-5'-thioadenosine phosphorylase [Chloroflexota bacterium]MDP6758590.1 S-methyl-5'-thioadenosine phosphorylase [Chloroflexota bacterium]
MATAKLGIIGGSGFYDMEGLTGVEEAVVETPFGDPSDAYRIGMLEGLEVAFLPRHGRGHLISPTNLNSKANIWGFKSLGVDSIVSVSAVGSLKEEIRPLDVVVPDQFFDRTRNRATSYFDASGLVVHTGMAEPFCPVLSALVADAAEGAGASVHRGGAYVCIEGPQFSTVAESEVFRGWGMSVIGMTAVPEVRLAREAELHYATFAMATDYDVWKGEPVTVEMVIANLGKNVAMAKSAVRALAANLREMENACGCRSALENSIISDTGLMPDAVKKQYELLIGKYVD